MFSSDIKVFVNLSIRDYEDWTVLGKILIIVDKINGRLQYSSSPALYQNSACNILRRNVPYIICSRIAEHNSHKRNVLCNGIACGSSESLADESRRH